MTLQETLFAEPPPVRLTDEGTLRVANTRITLDVVLGAYLRGEHPEAIAASFEGLTLADVHGVIRYYLRHQAEVESYLARRQKEAASIRAKIETVAPQGDIRARLLARQSPAEPNPC